MELKELRFAVIASFFSLPDTDLGSVGFEGENANPIVALVIAVEIASIFVEFTGMSAGLIVDMQVEYPNGQGSLGTAPDHDRYQLRSSGSWLPGAALLQGLNLQWDGAWDKVEQDDSFEPYTVNPDLLVPVPVPQTDLDAELETTSVDLRANYRPRWQSLRKLAPARFLSLRRSGLRPISETPTSMCAVTAPTSPRRSIRFLPIVTITRGKGSALPATIGCPGGAPS